MPINLLPDRLELSMCSMRSYNVLKDVNFEGVGSRKLLSSKPSTFCLSPHQFSWGRPVVRSALEAHAPEMDFGTSRDRTPGDLLGFARRAGSSKRTTNELQANLESSCAGGASSGHIWQFYVALWPSSLEVTLR